MDRIFTLHADHEQNASTSTVRLVGSTGANPYACIAEAMRLGFNWAKGPFEMLEEIGTVDKIPEFIAQS